MKNKIVTKVVASVLALAMMVTVGDCGVTYAASGSVTVSTQKQLNAALKNKKVERVTIKTKKAATFKIKGSDKNLVVDAPKATIINTGKWNNIIVKDAKKFMEKGMGVDLTIKDKNTLVLGVSGAAELAMCRLNSSKIKLTLCGDGEWDNIFNNVGLTLVIPTNISVNCLSEDKDTYLQIDGTVGTIYLDQSAVNLEVSGSTATTPNVWVGVSDCVITSSVKLNVEAKDYVDLRLEAGAEDSTLSYPGYQVITSFETFADIITDEDKYSGLPETVTAVVDGKTAELKVAWDCISGDDIAETGAHASDRYVRFEKAGECVLKANLRQKHLYVLDKNAELPTIRVTYTGGTSNNASTGTTSEDADESSSASSGKITI